MRLQRLVILFAAASMLISSAFGMATIPKEPYLYIPTFQRQGSAEITTSKQISHEGIYSFESRFPYINKCKVYEYRRDGKTNSISVCDQLKYQVFDYHYWPAEDERIRCNDFWRFVRTRHDFHLRTVYYLDRQVSSNENSINEMEISERSEFRFRFPYPRKKKGEEIFDMILSLQSHALGRSIRSYSKNNPPDAHGDDIEYIVTAGNNGWTDMRSDVSTNAPISVVVRIVPRDFILFRGEFHPDESGNYVDISELVRQSGHEITEREFIEISVGYRFSAETGRRLGRMRTGYNHQLSVEFPNKNEEELHREFFDWYGYDCKII